MGQFDKDQLGRIIPHTSKNGKELLDNMGRRVNDKGYLIDPNGNIIDVNNK
jgi:catechol-2,3-dioxygenase